MSFMAMPKAGRYYTAFASFDRDPSEFHCTHKFLGQLPSEMEAAIIEGIDNFFKSAGDSIKGFRVLGLGQEYIFDGVRALAVNGGAETLKAFDPLRKYLNAYRIDDFSEYIPHVTIPTFLSDTPKELHAQRYVLMKNGKVFREWVL